MSNRNHFIEGEAEAEWQKWSKQIAPDNTLPPIELVRKAFVAGYVAAASPDHLWARGDDELRVRFQIRGKQTIYGGITVDLPNTPNVIPLLMDGVDAMFKKVAEVD